MRPRYSSTVSTLSVVEHVVDVALEHGVGVKRVVHRRVHRDTVCIEEARPIQRLLDRPDPDWSQRDGAGRRIDGEMAAGRKAANRGVRTCRVLGWHIPTTRSHEWDAGLINEDRVGLIHDGRP